MTTLTATAPAAIVRPEPKRWTLHPEVIDSPACAMSQYADYRTAFYLVSGFYPLTTADTYEEILDKGRIWADRSSRIVRVPMIPYYDAREEEKYSRPVGTPPAAGGTVAGMCGATLWVRDTDRAYRDTYSVLHALGGSSSMQDTILHGYNVSTLQAWWVNGIAARHPTLDGFHVECEQKRREHGPLCAALDIEWDWRDYAPFTDQGHDTQIALF